MLLYKYSRSRCCSVKHPTAEGGVCALPSDLANLVDEIAWLCT
jgi:hypothetical protein